MTWPSILGVNNTLKTSQVAEKGRTAKPTRRSATAKFTKKKDVSLPVYTFREILPMKKFVTLLSLCEQKTAAITKQFPTITRISIKPKTDNDIKCLGSVHSTDSMSRVHSVSFISYSQGVENFCTKYSF